MKASRSIAIGIIAIFLFVAALLTLANIPFPYPLKGGKDTVRRDHFSGLLFQNANFQIIELIDFKGQQRVYIVKLDGTPDLKSRLHINSRIDNASPYEKAYVKTRASYLAGTGLSLGQSGKDFYSPYDKDIGSIALFGIWLYLDEPSKIVGIFTTQP